MTSTLAVTSVSNLPNYSETAKSRSIVQESRPEKPHSSSLDRTVIERFYDLPVFITEPDFFMHSSNTFSPVGIKIAEYAARSGQNAFKVERLVHSFIDDIAMRFKGRFRNRFSFKRLDAICAHTAGDLAVAGIVQAYCPKLQLVRVNPETGEGAEQIRGKKIAHISDLVNTGQHAAMQIAFEQNAGADVLAYFHLFNVPNGGVSRIQEQAAIGHEVLDAYAFDFSKMRTLEMACRQLKEGLIAQKTYDEMKVYARNTGWGWQVVQLKKHPEFARSHPEISEHIRELFDSDTARTVRKQSERIYPSWAKSAAPK